MADDGEFSLTFSTWEVSGIYATGRGSAHLPSHCSSLCKAASMILAIKNEATNQNKDPPPSSLFLYFSAKFPFQLNSCIQLRCCPVRMTRVTWIVTWHDQIAICSFYLSFSSFSLFRRHWMLMHIISFQLAGVSLPPFPPINFLWLFLIVVVVVVVVSSSMNTNRNDRD